MIIIDIQKKLKSSTGDMLLDVQLNIEAQSFVTLYGKSGAGKTSILRMLSGLFTPDLGTITVNNETWFDTATKINLSPQKRKIGFLFQDYALFPNMTVRENLLFACEKGQDKKIIHSLIDMMELGALQHRNPQTLSGGQQQRVALARALVQKPKILLLDEPLSALDLEMRQKLQTYLLEVHSTYQLTTILISHDISEITKLSDKIIQIDNGKIIRTGNPSVFFSNNNSQPIQLSGIISKIEKKDTHYVLSISMNNNVLNLIKTKNEIKNFNIGDRILMDGQINNIGIKKV